MEFILLHVPNLHIYIDRLNVEIFESKKASMRLKRATRFSLVPQNDLNLIGVENSRHAMAAMAAIPLGCHRILNNERT